MGKVGKMLSEIRASFGKVAISVELQGPNGCDENNRVWTVAKRPGHDIEELLAAKIGTKTTFCHDKIAESERGLGGDQRGTSMGDVPKRSAMNKRWTTLNGLNKVGTHRIAH